MIDGGWSDKYGHAINFDFTSNLGGRNHARLRRTSTYRIAASTRRIAASAATVRAPG